MKGQTREALPLIKEAIEQSAPLENIAVICITNSECQEAAEILREDGIPVFVRTSDQYATTPATPLLEGAAEWSAFLVGRRASHWQICLQAGGVFSATHGSAQVQ